MTKTITPRIMGIKNAKAIFRLIQAKGPISRVEIARLTGLSKPAVSSSVRRLLQKKLVVEGDFLKSDRVGRRPRLLALNPQAAYFISIDIGGTYVRFGLADLSGSIIAKRAVATPASWERLVEAIIENIAHSDEWSGIPYEKIKGLALGVPGVVDSEGTVHFAPNIENNVRSFPLRERLQARVSLPILLENDVNIAALGEFAKRDKQYSNLIYISIGTGIGAGIVMNGDLYRGVASHAGEVGWLIVSEDYLTISHYDTWGYLEKEASGPALVRKARQLLKNRPNDPLFPKLEGLDLGIIFKEYNSSKAAKELVDRWIREIAILICNVSSILDPEIVILGGGVIDAGKDFLKDIKALVKSNIQRVPEIELSRCQGEAGLYGGVEACLSRLDTLICETC